MGVIRRGPAVVFEYSGRKVQDFVYVVPYKAVAG